MTTTTAQASKRHFAVHGPIFSAEQQNNFYVDPTNWNEKNLLPFVMREEYFVLVGPSQTGKTTRALSFMQTLQSHHQITTIRIDMSSVVAQVQQGKGSCWSIMASVFNKEGIPVDDKTLFSMFLIYGPPQSNPSSIFLVLDEFQAIQDLPEDQRIALLTILHSVKQTPSRWLKSLMVITTYCGYYMISSLGSASNVSSNRVAAPYWSKEEVFDLIQQYEEQEQISIPTELKSAIFNATTGAQGETQMLCMYLTKWVERNGRVPSLQEWRTETTLFNEQFYLFITGFEKYQKMVEEMRRPEIWVPLVTWLQDPSISIDEEALEKLESANILRVNDYRLCIASPLVARLVRFQLQPREHRNILVPIPTTIAGTVDVLGLVAVVVQRMSLYRCNSAPRRYKLNEASYRNEFQQTLSNVFYHACPVVEPERLVPMKTNAVDLVQFYHDDKLETIAIEHAANVNDGSLRDHVYKQANTYHEGLKPTLGTLVLHWTTVNKPTFPFFSANGVTLIHIWHDELFQNWTLYTKSNAPITVLADALLIEDDEDEVKSGDTTFTKEDEMQASENTYSVAIPELEEKLHKVLRKLFDVPAASTIHIVSKPGGDPVDFGRLKKGKTYFIRVITPVPASSQLP